MEALSSNELFNFIIYDTISATPYGCNASLDTNFISQNVEKPFEYFSAVANNSPNNDSPTTRTRRGCSTRPEKPLAVECRKKRPRRRKVCKNKEEAETQRMTHITVERNRRKQMNEHLALLRSLMPESYVQRGDQASIVGGAIDFVKELEHLLQTLEAQKFLQLQNSGRDSSSPNETATATAVTTTTEVNMPNKTPFSQFFGYPQNSCCSQMPNKLYSCSKINGEVGEIEVTLVETHANIRALSRKRLRQISRMVSGFQTINLTILHLNVTILHPLVLYSISAKVEEGCQLKTADDIAAAVEHMLRIIDQEEAIPLPIAETL